MSKTKNSTFSEELKVPFLIAQCDYDPANSEHYAMLYSIYSFFIASASTGWCVFVLFFVTICAVNFVFELKLSLKSQIEMNVLYIKSVHFHSLVPIMLFPTLGTVDNKFVNFLFYSSFPAEPTQWEKLGFQGGDPRTDLNRSMKILSVVQVGAFSVVFAIVFGAFVIVYDPLRNIAVIFCGVYICVLF